MSAELIFAAAFQLLIDTSTDSPVPCLLPSPHVLHPQVGSLYSIFSSLIAKKQPLRLLSLTDLICLDVLTFGPCGRADLFGELSWGEAPLRKVVPRDPLSRGLYYPVLHHNG